VQVKIYVGIAIGAGTDVAIETADIILVKSNPNDATANGISGPSAAYSEGGIVATDVSSAGSSDARYPECCHKSAKHRS
jgi:hypothetical protein